jgi:hypothetical protein
MPTSAKLLFDAHVAECREAVSTFDFMLSKAGFKADFNLRFVWIAAVSALDHYISQVILERATYAYGNKLPLQPKLLADVMSFGSAIELREADPIRSVVVFRSILDSCIRYKSFQYPEKIADGLSYVWQEKQKWHYIATKVGMSAEGAKKKLDAIVDRRNLIAHNGDYDEARGAKLPISKSDTEEVIKFTESIVAAIDSVFGP